ncbi:MAG: GNAT family N-acetyltransferase [Massilia sp.]
MDELNNIYPLMHVDIALLERWLRGWSATRGLPAPRRSQGGLIVEVGLPDQLRRYVFADAGAALQECARTIRQAHVHLKAPVDAATLLAALPPGWTLETPRFLMAIDGPMAPPPALPFKSVLLREHGAQVLHFLDSSGVIAASGRIVIENGSAVFDRIATHPDFQRRGLGRAVMGRLDALAVQAGVKERLLVATEDGRALYLRLGWQELSPYSTAISPSPT